MTNKDTVIERMAEALETMPPKSDTPFDERYISEWVFIHQDAIRQALAEYEKLKAETVPQSAIPDGYVLVPIEPTDEMMDAWNEEIEIVHAVGYDPETKTYHDCHVVECELDAYKAMIAAAPTPPTQGDENDTE